MSQKLPLFGGIIAPVHNTHRGDPTLPTVVAIPPDAALNPAGSQAYYEIHLWLKPGEGDEGDEELYGILAQIPGEIPRPVWGGSLSNTFGGVKNAPPLKILDGYPLRGNVTLSLVVVTPAAQADAYPAGVQVFGYYYRVGAGAPFSAERRFIGPARSDNIAGGPFALTGADNEKVLHILEPNRIDEVGLYIRGVDENDLTRNVATLLFEDEDGDVLIPGHEVNIYVPPDVERPAPYLIETVFGGGIPLPGLSPLGQIRLRCPDTIVGGMIAHGYFTRR